MLFVSEVVQHLYIIYSKASLRQRFLEYWRTTILPSSLYTPKSRNCLSTQWGACTEWQSVLSLPTKGLPHCLTRLCRVQSSLTFSQAKAVTLQPHWNTKTSLGVQNHACGCLTHLEIRCNATSLFHTTNSSRQGSNSLISGNDWWLYTAFRSDLEPLLALCPEEDLV